MKLRISTGTPSKKTGLRIAADSLAEVAEILEGVDEWGRYVSNEGYSFKSDRKGGKEIVTEVTITARPHIYMPEWNGKSKAPRAEQKAWDKMSKALRAHEDEHHAVFTTELETYRRTLSAAKEMTKSELVASWARFQKDLKAAQEKFDKSTGHGAKKGVEIVVPGD